MNINLDKEMKLFLEAACGVGQNPDNTGCTPASAPKIKMPKFKMPSLADMEKKRKERKRKRDRPDRKPNIVNGVDVIRDKEDEQHFLDDLLLKGDKGVDGGEYDDKMREQYEEQQKKKTPEQKKQQREDILSWKTLGGFEAIERAVADGTHTREEIRERNERISEVSHTTITNVDRPIERGISVPNDVAEQILDDFVEGEMVEIPDESGHGSSGFSTSADTARSFANVDDENSEQTSIIFRIKPNSNGQVRGAFIDGEPDEDGGHWGEGEITRSSKSKAKVVSVERTRLPNGKMVVIVTLQESDDLSEAVFKEAKEEKEDILSKKYLEGPLNPEPKKKSVKEDIKPDVIKSFVIRNSLNTKLWDGDKLKPEIRKKLLIIAKNFFKDLELESNIKLHDITLTGSISNYNWSKFSDVDLHLRLDFSQIDDDENFVKNYVLAKKTIWNNKHDIKIYGFPVEVYVENLGDIHVASGLYSILKDEWLVVPKKKELQIDLDDIRSKAEGYLGSVPVLQKMMKDGKYDEVVTMVEKIQEKLKRMRSSGLERGGEFSVENLAFKALRRSPFIADILKMKIDSYDKKMSMKEESNLTKELIKPFLTKGELNEVGEKYYWPKVKFPYMEGSGYDTVKRAKSTIRSIKSWSKSEQRDIVETMYNRAKYHDTQTGGMRKAMEIFEQWLNEAKIKKVVGIYGGRFQPFGPHHKKTYEWLKKQVDVAYITTSNIKTPPKHPFNYKEKVRHMTKMGIPKNRIINEKSPLRAEKTLKKYDSDTTAVIYIFGEKDAGRLSGGKKKSGGLSYFQDYKKNKKNIKGYEEHGYFITAPHVSIKVGGKEVSGTVMRNLLNPNADPKPTPKLFKQAFGYYDEGIFMMMVNKFGKLSKEGITEATGGKLIAARNKGHLKNSGETALDSNGIISKFKGRGDISDAFSFAVKDLERAIGALSDKQRNKIFMNGKAWMNLEVMWPKSANVINYDKAEIVFHGALEYDDNGNAVGEVKGSGRMLAGMIKQVNKNIQKHYKIGKPNFLTVPKHQDFDKKKKYFVGKLNKLQRTYGLKDNDTLALYHQRFWEEFIHNAEKQFGVKISNKSYKLLVQRWAFFDKSYKIPQIRKDLAKFPKFLDWVLTTDKVDHSKMVKANMKPFEELFFEVGAEIMKNVSGWLAASPDSTVQRVKKQLDSAISNVKSGGDLKKLNTLKLQLDKLKSIGGLDAIVPSEGIVFKYNGKTYKFTGAFAPINQITGLMTF